MNIIPPKYLMLNGKNAFPKVTYENFLIDIINFSQYFSTKHSFMEHFILTTEQAHGEDDAYTSTYQLDFKLLVGTNVMRMKNRNMPEVDYSHMSQGFIFSKTQELEEEIPDETILLDIAKVKIEDLRNEVYANDTIKSVVKNIKKPKNLFMYYPYEYVLENSAEYVLVVSEILNVFKNLLIYRDELKLGKDTFLCLKINDYFEIYEWRKQEFVRVDKVSEYSSANYRDLKTYSVY